MNTKKAVGSLCVLFLLGVVAPQLDTIRRHVSTGWLAIAAMMLGLGIVVAWFRWSEELRDLADDLSKPEWYTDVAIVIVGYVLLPIVVVALGIGLGINFI